MKAVVWTVFCVLAICPHLEAVVWMKYRSALHSSTNDGSGVDGFCVLAICPHLEAVVWMKYRSALHSSTNDGSGVDISAWPENSSTWGRPAGALFPLEIVFAGAYFKVELGYAQVHLGVSHQ